MTLVELIIVVAVMGILLATAVPSYQTYMLRVHRTEAIRMLLQVAMCGAQMADACGSLSLDQNGNRIANGSKTNSVKCWNGR
jgi:type IV pilus assembly protein PilE